MITQKKTLYEILEVSSNASDVELKAAHQRISQKLELEKNDLNQEDVDFRLRVVNVAFRTLSVQRTREAYDARLAVLNAPAVIATPPSAVALPANPEAMSLKVDAMSLRADAISLKADAVMLRAEAMSLKVAAPSSIELADKVPSKRFGMLFGGLVSPFKTVLTVIGGLIAMGMVIQVAFLLLVSRQSDRVAIEATKAEEKVMLQQYYQENGVRAGSRIEADLLDAEKRREEKELRAKQDEERKYEQFVEDSRRMGDRVSEDLRRAEEQARREEEQKKFKLEEEKRMKEEAERERIENEMRKWKS